MTEHVVGITSGYFMSEESDVAVRVHLDLHDADPADVLLDMSEDSIQIAAEMNEEFAVAEGMMSAKNTMYRRVPLPPGLDMDQLEIIAEHGYLDVMIPKKQVE